LKGKTVAGYWLLVIFDFPLFSNGQRTNSNRQQGILFNEQPAKSNP